jgi:hypothetical protein
MPEVHWTYAKTYPDAPHEYILRWRYPEVFEKYRRLIRHEGVKRPFTFRGRTNVYRYYYGEHGWKYWVIGHVLSRARIPPKNPSV